MAVRIRRSVNSLSPTSPELMWYGRAVAALQALPRTKAGSWEFVAACHGIDNNVAIPAAAKGLWRECQHQTWFFLSWHRAYITAFEAIVATQIAKLGGPANWALPYWDYSAPGVASRQLPEAFRSQTLGDGSRNPLWSPRNQPVFPQTVLTIPTGSTSLSALNEHRFSAPVGSANPGFGGPQTAQATHFGQLFGLPSGKLEDLPHNIIHGDIGGLMSNPNTAALDPIFWLHHCNIDRLWETWRKKLTPAIADPKETQWLSTVKFRLLTDKPSPVTFASKQALDSQTLLHGFKYDSVQPVVPAGAGAVATKTPMSQTTLTATALPELLAANQAGLKLSDKRADTVVKFSPNAIAKKPIGMALGHGAPAMPAQRYYLNLEAVVAAGPARDYRVFIDLPDDDRVPMEVGMLATFGTGPASDPTGNHGGGGLMKIFDITDAVAELGIGTAQLKQIRVTFDPIRRGQVEQTPADFPYAQEILQQPNDLTVGRVSIFAE